MQYSALIKTFSLQYLLLLDVLSLMTIIFQPISPEPRFSYTCTGKLKKKRYSNEFTSLSLCFQFILACFLSEN